MMMRLSEYYMLIEGTEKEIHEESEEFIMNVEIKD